MESLLLRLLDNAVKSNSLSDLARSRDLGEQETDFPTRLASVDIKFPSSVLPNSNPVKNYTASLLLVTLKELICSLPSWLV